MYQDIIKFWFKDIQPSQWWVKNLAFDRLVLDKFSEIHLQASQCELYEWREKPLGRLAEIIVLDQFSRNMFRGSALSFAYDSMALTLSQEAVSLGVDQKLSPIERSFLYMPYMHSESLKIHDVAMRLFQMNGIQNNFDYEIKHRDVIEKFGRYPHRNELLGRESTKEEIVFLNQPGSRF